MSAYTLPTCGDDFVCGCRCGCTRNTCTKWDEPMCACDDTPRCDDCHLSGHCEAAA